MPKTEFRAEIQVPANRIHPNPNNPRREAGDVTELAASIRENGILQSVLLIPDTARGGDYFLLEAGFRRWTAARQIAEAYPIPARVSIPKPGENMASRALITGLVENLHREGLGPMEKAHAYGRLRKEFDMTQAQIAKRVGLKSAGSVSRYLSLLDLSEATQDRVASGKLTVEDAAKAVVRTRQRARIAKGQKPVDNGWEPDHFTKNHFLWRKAKKLCDDREHNNRRRLGDVACGKCWEDVIRRDQTTVDQNTYQEVIGKPVPFLSPENGLLEQGRREAATG